MKTSKRVLIPVMIVVIILVLSVPSSLLKFIYGSRVEFDPNKFLNEYFKFLTSIVLTLFGFYLANVFWKNRQESKSIKSMELIRSRILIQIDSFLNETNKLFESVGNNEISVDDGWKKIKLLFEKKTSLVDYFFLELSDLEISKEQVKEIRSQIQSNIHPKWEQLKIEIKKGELGFEFKDSIDKLEEKIKEEKERTDVFYENQ